MKQRRIGTRALALLLTLAMCLSLLPMTALAGADMVAFIFADEGCDYLGDPAITFNPETNEVESVTFPNGRAFELDASGTAKFSLSLDLPIKGFQMSALQTVSLNSQSKSYTLYDNGSSQYDAFFEDPTDPWLQNIVIADFVTGAYHVAVRYAGTIYTDPYAITFDSNGSAGTRPEITTSYLESGFVGEAYAQQLEGTTGDGSASLTWSITSAEGLPAGLSLNASTGEITGTPTVQGPFSFIVTAEQGNGETASRQLSITVNAPLKYLVKFYLNGGTEAAGEDYSPRSVASGTAITLPAAPTLTGYDFGGWKYGDTVYQAGDSCTVTGRVNFTAKWTEKDPVTVAVPDLGQLVGTVWLKGYYSNDPNDCTRVFYRYFSNPVASGEALKTIDLSIWNFTGGRQFTKLELCAYVDGVETVIAAYDGTVGESSEGVALTKTAAEYAVLNSSAAAGLTSPDDYRINSVKRNENYLHAPCLVSPGPEGYSVSLCGVYGSDKYGVYDWNNIAAYSYAFDAGTGVLTVTIPKVGAPSVPVTGKVTFKDGTPVAGVTVKAGQYYKGLHRTATAVTGEDGSYALDLYPGSHARLTVYSGTEQLYMTSGYDINSPADSVTNNIRIEYAVLRGTFRVKAAAGQEDLVDRYLRSQFSTPMVEWTFTGAVGGVEKTDTRTDWVDGRSDSFMHSLTNTAGAGSIQVKLTGDAFEEAASQTVTVSAGVGTSDLELTPKPGVLVRLTSASSITACMAWYDSAGAYVGKSGSFTVSDSARDRAFVCPGDPGSYSLVLVPAAYSSCLRGDISLGDLPDGAKTRVWTAVIEAGKITELEAFAANKSDALSAVYLTKPGSTLYASAESFSNAGEVISFTGSIGLDPGLKDGKLKELKIRTGVSKNGHTVWNSAPVQALVINGVDYMEKLNYTYHNTFYYISGLDIELPCEYTLYCSPGSAVEYDMDLTLSAKVAYDNGKYASDQLIGSAVVKRPGAYLDTLSAYVNREEIQVSGRAQPFEEVTVFDNDVLVGGAAADKWGEWTAQVTLSGVSAADATTHILTSRSASGEESDELWILHDPDGPQLTSFTMTWTEWGTRTINVGDPYTFYGGAMRDVTFTAVIDNPDALEVMTEWGPNVKAVTKVFTTDGEIRFLPMTQDGDTFTGKVDTALRDSITYAELLYVPAAEETAVTAETVETVTPVSTAELDELMPDSGSVEALTPADDWSVTFDGDVPTLSGNTEGLSSDEFQQAADNLRQKGFQIRSITMMHDVSGTEHSTLAWLNSIYEQRLADETDHAVIYTFAGALDSKEAFDNAVENIRKIAVDTHGTGEGILPFRITDAAGHTVYRFILTDAWTYEGETTYTYFIYAIFLESTEGGKTAYTANIYVQLAEDFVGYFRLPAGDDPEVTGLLSEPGELYTDSSLTRLMGHLTTGTSSGISSDNGPMYGYPADRQDLKEMEASASGPPPKPSEKYYGKFDLNKVESYTQKQQNMLEDVTANGSGMFGLVGDGAGWIGNALGVASYIKAIERRNRYSGYVSDMRDEIWNLETKPCFGALNSTQKSLVKKLIREIDQAWAGYQLSNIGANLTDLGINLASIGGGLAGLSWKKGAALTVGVYTSGKVNGGANDKVFNRFVEKYEHSYKTIDSMYRNAAASTGNPDCKKDEKAKNSNTNKVRTSEGGPIPQNNDPSGIVYEGVIQNPVEGAQVTLYYGADAAGSIVREGTAVDAETGKKTGTGAVETGRTVSNLKSAEDVRYLLPQEAVQLTGEDGKFSWGVPEGLWFVTAQYAGMEGSSNADKAAVVNVSGLNLDGEAVTNLLPVLPVQLDVNIPLVDATAPVVEDVRFTEEGIYVTFSKYMEDMAGDSTSVLTAGNYVLTDEEENAVALTVTSEVQGNTPDNLRGEAVKTFTKTVRLTPVSGSFPAGDLTLTVAGTVTSYAGTAMGLNCVETAQVSPMVQLGKPTFGLASGTGVQRGDTVSISLPADAPEGARICYTTDGSDPAAGKVYDGPVAVTDDMTIRAVAVCTGWKTSEETSASFTIAKAKTAEEIQGSVTASVTDGGLSVRVVPPFGETFAAGFCAAYDKDGKMLAVQPLSNAGGEQTLTLPCDAGKACTVKVFLLDSKSCPVTKPLTWKSE